MKNYIIITIALIGSLAYGCGNNSANSKINGTNVPADSAQVENTASVDDKTRKVADGATILARKQVPILCYHQIRNWTGSDSKSGKDYITPVETFKQHIKMLADSGYQIFQTHLPTILLCF